LFEVDKQIFLWINGLAGRSAVADYIIQGIANDYFVIVSFCLGLLAIWFGSTSKEMQKAVIAAVISIGLASLLVVLSNHFYFRPRPFTELPTTLLFYKPGDSSFPSNMATVLMAISIPIFWTNKKIGGLFIGVSIIASLARVYIGIHYPFDIMGGFILALAAAVAAIYILKILGKYVDLFLKMLQKVCLA